MTEKTYTIDIFNANEGGGIEPGSILDQLINLDGREAILIEEVAPILNGSKRVCGHTYRISADTADILSDPAAYGDDETGREEAAEWAEYFASQD
ncbi:hypothetical protein ACXR2T_10530 [Leucobacter sp. HY1910]